MIILQFLNQRFVNDSVEGFSAGHDLAIDNHPPDRGVVTGVVLGVTGVAGPVTGVLLGWQV